MFGKVVKYQVFSAEFHQSTVGVLADLTREVNVFSERIQEQTGQVKSVEWLQTQINETSTRLTAIIAYVHPS
ncbi:hypothetical protein IPM19_04295 [bacterium]|nr:MAG: hypothetical protein IPM19_04295 [bacterium]